MSTLSQLKRISSILGIVLLMSVLLVGCSNSGTEKKPAKEAFTITDLAGRQVSFEKPANKVLLQLSGSGGAFMTIAALEGNDLPKVIAGMDPGLKKNRNDMWKLYVEKFPELEKTPNIGNPDTNDFNTELAISLKPDVIFLPIIMKKQFEGDISSRLEKAGIKVVYIDYHAETIDTHVRTIQIIGKVMGKEERAQEIADFYKKHVENVYSKVAHAKETPSVYLEVGNKGPKGYGNAFGKDFSWGMLLNKVHTDSISASVIPTAGALNPELILEKNPNIIFVMGANWQKQPTAMTMGVGVTPEEAQKHLEAFTTRPGWDHLQAVKNKQVYSMYHGMAREVYDFAAIEYLAKVTHPELFKDTDPNADLQEFYKKFLPVPYKGTWFYQLH